MIDHRRHIRLPCLQATLVLNQTSQEQFFHVNSFHKWQTQPGPSPSSLHKTEAHLSSQKWSQTLRDAWGDHTNISSHLGALRAQTFTFTHTLSPSAYLGRCPELQTALKAHHRHMMLCQLGCIRQLWYERPTRYLLCHLVADILLKKKKIMFSPLVRGRFNTEKYF